MAEKEGDFGQREVDGDDNAEECAGTLDHVKLTEPPSYWFEMKIRPFDLLDLQKW